MAVDTNEVQRDWLARFSLIFSNKSAKLDSQLQDVFLLYGWLKDALVFGWNNRSLEGIPKISKYLSSVLPQVTLENLVPDDKKGLQPETFVAKPGVEGVQFGFCFESPAVTARGFARLLQDEAGAWKALTVYTRVEEIKGHEERGYESGLYGGHTISWGEVRAQRRAEIEKNPRVLIIGAGHSGLNVAARFAQMGIPTLVIDKKKRVGDAWRDRYPTLTLHTPRSHHNFLYSPFPDNWPIFTPRDKLADWMEHYSMSHDLVVWNSTEISSQPQYNAEEGTWTVRLDKAGQPVVIQPAHIVVATGLLGDPNIPRFDNQPFFRGDLLHTSDYKGGDSYKDKHVVVLGAGNSGADICQDLSFRGAASVTLVQRSATCVVSSKYVAHEFTRTWPEGGDVEVSDMKVTSFPLAFLKRVAIETDHLAQEFDKDMHDTLRKGGLKLTRGPDGAGQLIQVFERGGGYWIDVGLADVIGQGKIKIKQGVEIKDFTRTGVIFTDGTEAYADAVIFATGFKNIRPSITSIFGSEVIDQTSDVWGLDEEGEIRGCYRPSGHPGLWFAAGDFYCSRFMSKHLGLLIQAEELGLQSYPCFSSIP